MEQGREPPKLVEPRRSLGGRKSKASCVPTPGKCLAGKGTLEGKQDTGRWQGSLRVGRLRALPFHPGARLWCADSTPS